MKVAFLAGSDAFSTRLSVESVCRIPGVKVVSLLLDTARPPFSRRLRNLRRNIRREGPSYMVHRSVEFVADWLDQRATKFAHREAARDLLRTAFPQSALGLEDLASRYGFQLLPVNNLNSPEAAEFLRRSGAELGIVLGTRILRRSTFSVPKLGCINLHKGAVPEYRGLPPGFWELFDGRSHAGITVHFVDAGLDTGDIVSTREIPVHPRESEESLRRKLDYEGAAVLATCVEDISRDSFTRIPQKDMKEKPRTNPTGKERSELRRRLPYLRQSPAASKRIVKTTFHLALYYSGIYHLVRLSQRRRSRAKILLYHRVNNFSFDVLTVSTTHFAEQLAMLRHRYKVRDTSWLLDRLEKKEHIPSDTVLIHFDDCYRDVLSQAAPLLNSANMPATAFIATGFVGTSRQFDHDRAKSPFTHENLSPGEIRELREMGFSIGAHTVNHVDLARSPLHEVQSEVLQSRADLEKILESPVDLFSFPFGRIANISEEARSFIIEARFRALFSAYGGTVTARSSVFDIPRMGAGQGLDLMMEIEGISIGDWYRRMLRRRVAPAS